jgi:photosystem II stability/assembly factor-like uncharacterized protein
MRSHRTLFMLIVLSVALTALGGCKKKSGGGTGGGGGGAWLVGADGEMVNVRGDGTLGEGYALGVDDDLLAITCRGLDTAFVAGESGTLLRTFDGGESWESIDLGTSSTLRDVAAAHDDVVYVAGDAGLWRSPDSGDSWTELAAGDRAWSSIATHGDGGTALALAADGAVWRWVDGAAGLAPATTLTGARAIALSHDGRFAAVAGDRGGLLVSDDGGLTWAPHPTGTAVDLHAVWVTSAGHVLAVGDAGTIVRLDDDGLSVETPGSGTLRAVHLNGAGVGLAAGDGGEVLSTSDGGRTWSALDLGVTAVIYGLDEIDGAGHL